MSESEIRAAAAALGNRVAHLFDGVPLDIAHAAIGGLLAGLLSRLPDAQRPDVAMLAASGAYASALATPRPGAPLTAPQRVALGRLVLARATAMLERELAVGEIAAALAVAAGFVAAQAHWPAMPPPEVLGTWFGTGIADGQRWLTAAEKDLCVGSA